MERLRKTSTSKENPLAEMIKGRKLTLREILDEIAEDEEFSDEERELARDKSKQLDTESRIHEVK